MITRDLSSEILHSKKSILLLGPRQTGKSTLINNLNPDLSINLMHEPSFLNFAANPYELENRLSSEIEKHVNHARPLTVFIDEVQRLPSLLNSIQTYIDKWPHLLKFYLTGSSARKLKRGQANLLPGRIHTFRLGPVLCSEMNFTLNTRSVVSTGCLPGILSETDQKEKQKTLRSYAATYLKEEIQAESLTRGLEGFARFLTISAEWSGHFLDLSKLAQAAQVARQSVVRWFEILEDTLVVFRVNAFAKSQSKRLVQHPRFFFFDIGVLNGMLGNFEVSADRIGNLFEHLVISQIYHGLLTKDAEFRLSTWRTEHGAEVDLILEYKKNTYALEIKASQNVSTQDLRGIKNFADYSGKNCHPFVLYTGTARKKMGPVEVLPWQEGIEQILNS